MAGSLNHILSTARLGMSANQTAIGVVSHNISNAETPGYSRQRASLVANTPLLTAQGSLGTGVLVRDIPRIRDNLLDPGFRGESSDSGFWQRKSDLLAGVESLHGDITTGGLRTSLEAFWNGWSDLSNDPTSSTARTVVRQTATQLVSQFRNIATGLDRLRQDAGIRLNQDISTVNQLSASIARLNDRVVAAEAGGTSAPDLRDERDRAVDELSKLVGVQVIEHANGSIGVHIGGINLVDGPDAVPLTVNSAGGTFSIVSQRGGVVRKAGGAIGGIVDFLNTDVVAARAELDQLARALVDSVNTIHRTGMNAAGRTGLSFFDDFGAVGTVTAATLALSPDIPDALSIAAGTGVIDPISGNPVYAAGRNDVALALSGLRTAPSALLAGRSIGEAYIDSIGRIGADLNVAIGNAGIHQTLAAQADLRRASVNGVSIDEEMVALIRFQNAYAAAARVISTVDEMMQTIIEMKR